MPEIVTMGELLCEIMRPSEDTELYETGEFRGPFPSGAPGIFISTAARLGCRAGIIAGVGKDDFGKNILDRLKKDGVDLSRVLESDKGPTGTAFVTYYSNGDRKFIFHVVGTPAVEPKAPADMKGLEEAKYFHIMGCSLMAAVDFGKEVVKTMYLFRNQGTKISFDPNVRLEMMHDPKVLDTVQEAVSYTHLDVYKRQTCNRYKGIRAALCSDCFSAEATREHNDANILAMGGRVVGPGLAVKIVDTFLHTEFSGDERHKRRISKIEDC